VTMQAQPKLMHTDAEKYAAMPETIETTAAPLPLDGYTMHLQPSEVALVTEGMADLDWFNDADPRALPDALQRLPSIDRAPVWEVSVRHFGRRKPLSQAAAEIGMDALHARDLLARLAEALDVPPASR
jgi:hypothetical protein